MWVIVSKEKPDVQYELICGREYTLGRKDADIVLENDMSISRKHAVLRASHSVTDVSNPQKFPMLTVEDLSKIGTMVDETRHVKNTGVINAGDTIWFGNLQADISKYTAVYTPCISTTSCLEAAAKKSTRQNLSVLGGHLVNEWRKDCDILIMSSLSITIKAICALIAQKPIVTPKYLDDWLKALDKGTKIPEPHDYLPPLAESQVDPRHVTFGPEASRLTIFQGQVFIFLTSKQFKKLSVAVELGGGTPLLMDENTDDVDLLHAPGSCVMSCDPNDQSQQLTKKAQNWIKLVIDLLFKHKKRPILESEVGFAVLYCSTKQHCNPDAAHDSIGVPTVPVVPQTLSQNLDLSQLQNTNGNKDRSQISSVRIKHEPISQKTEQETVSYSAVHSDNRKRVRADGSDAEVTPAKKTAITRGARGLKQEIITPQKPTGSDLVDRSKEMKSNPATVRQGEARQKENSPEPPRRNTRKHSPGPTPSSPKQQRRSTRRSPSPAPLSPEVPRRNTRKRSSSLAPPSPNPPRRSTRRSPSPAPTSSKPQRKNARKHSPSPDLYEAEPSAMESKPRVVSELVLSDEEEFSHRRRPNKRPRVTVSSNEEFGSSGGEDDMFASIPKRKGRGKADSRSTQKVVRVDSPSPERIIPKRNIKKQVAKSEPDVSIVREEVNVENPRAQNQENKPTSCNIKTEPKASYEDSAPSVSEAVTSNNGFISKRNMAMVAVDDEFIDKTVAIPNCTETEYVSLIYKKPTPTTDDLSDVCKWKGKVVKNFKRFSKVDRDDQALPHIIGGMDLFVHEDDQSQKHDEWFQEYLQDLPEQKNVDEDDDLFQFATRRTAPSSRKGRRS